MTAGEKLDKVRKAREVEQAIGNAIMQLGSIGEYLLARRAAELALEVKMAGARLLKEAEAAGETVENDKATGI